MTDQSPDSDNSVPRRVFITGANGFIGRALATHYRNAGSEVCGIDLRADEEWGVVAADLNAPRQWRSTLSGTDLVIHTAAIVSNTASMARAWKVNVAGTAGLLAACEHARVERFVHLSSVAAYGFDFDQDVAEDRPLRPMGNSYVDTKIASEHAVLASHAGGRLDSTIVRPGDVYGPGSRPWVSLPLQMLAAGRFLLPAHGAGIFSPVYIDDLVAGIALAAGAAAGRGQIFNIGGGQGVRCDEFFGYHARMLPGEPRLRCIGTPAARLLATVAGGAARMLGRPSELGRGTIDMLSRRAGYSIDKARDLLGYEPATGLEEGMARTRDWVLAGDIVANS